MGSIGGANCCDDVGIDTKVMKLEAVKESSLLIVHTINKIQGAGIEAVISAIYQWIIT